MDGPIYTEGTMPYLGRTLIFAGLLLVVTGLVVIGLGRVGLPLGRLPGDINLRGRNGSFSFPIVSCLVLSALASFALWLVGRLRR